MKRAMMLGALFVGACAATGSAQRAPDPDARPYLEARAIGEPRTCLARSADIEGTTGLSRQYMLFRMRGGALYRAEFSNSCPAAARDEAFSRTSTVGSFCANEILTFFDPVSGTPLGSCTITSFTEIENPKNASRAGE